VIKILKEMDEIVENPAVIIVIDNSKSIGETVLANIIITLHSFIEKLILNNIRVSIFKTSKVPSDDDRILPTYDIQNLSHFLKQIKIDKETSTIYPILNNAINLASRIRDCKGIYLISDGEIGIDDLNQCITKIKRSTVKVYTIKIYSEKDWHKSPEGKYIEIKNLAEIAKESGGYHIIEFNPDEIFKSLKTLSLYQIEKNKLWISQFFTKTIQKVQINKKRQHRKIIDFIIGIIPAAIGVIIYENFEIKKRRGISDPQDLLKLNKDFINDLFQKSKIHTAYEIKDIWPTIDLTPYQKNGMIHQLRYVYFIPCNKEMSEVIAIFTERSLENIELGLIDVMFSSVCK